jgi:hypothetical protein
MEGVLVKAAATCAGTFHAKIRRPFRSCGSCCWIKVDGLTRKEKD